MKKPFGMMDLIVSDVSCGSSPVSGDTEWMSGLSIENVRQRKILCDCLRPDNVQVRMTGPGGSRKLLIRGKDGLNGTARLAGVLECCSISFECRRNGGLVIHGFDELDSRFQNIFHSAAP